MPTEYDLILKNGTIYDGNGGPPYQGDVAIHGQQIAAVGQLETNRAKKIIDVKGLAVAPGFINVMSWANVSLIVDGKSQSDIRQGITLEIIGEGRSEGPINDEMKQETMRRQGDIKYEMPWNTLGEYLEYMAGRGIATNLASYLGAATLRINVIGYQDRPPTENELEHMRRLARQTMEEGAVGISTALIYPPGSYADTPELIELAKVVSEYGGIYISHIRNEGNSLLPALDELITIAREANIGAEIYHLKVTGRKNWHKMDKAIDKVNAARAEGLQITADMYTYPASATGLGATMPDWVQEGGFDAWLQRLQDPDTRQRLYHEMMTETEEWESSLLGAGGPQGVLLRSFKSEHLKPLIGKTLAEVSQMRGTEPAYTIMDLIVEDESNVGAVYFTMTEENLVKQLKQPWVCIGSDSESQAPEGVFLKSGVHPRAYGTFARFLGKYVREEKVLPLEEAIRRITSFPAEVRKIKERGQLTPGYFADVTVFDPDTIQDHATFAQPHQYSTGVAHVFVNGEQVLKDGEHTGALPGQVVRGPGYKGK
ncbi:MAG: D-aminoacylase [Anaerolineales bacterium]|nr:D-aminoacylase [Anaerolineales bacterium]